MMEGNYYFFLSIGIEIQHRVESETLSIVFVQVAMVHGLRPTEYGKLPRGFRFCFRVFSSSLFWTELCECCFRNFMAGSVFARAPICINTFPQSKGFLYLLQQSFMEGIPAY